jgi:hypothetical protein
VNGARITNNLDNSLASTTEFSIASSTLVGGTFPVDVVVQGHYAYTVNESNSTLSVLDVTYPNSPVLLANVQSGSLAAGGPRSLFASGRYLYVTNADTGILTIFDISRPAAPIVVGELLSLNNPDGVYVNGDRAYVIGLTGILYIIDVSNPTSPVLKNTTTISGGATNITFQGRYAYIANTDFTFSILDVASSTPLVVGTGTTDGSTGKSIAVSGKYLLTGGSDSPIIDIFNIGNPNTPVLLNTVTLSANPTGNGNNMFIAGRYAYVNTANGVNVIDISDPSNPSVILVFPVTSNLAGLFVSGKYVYTVSTATNKLYIINTTGIETNALLAHSADLGTLQVQQNATIFNNAYVGGALTVGSGGIYSQGSLTASASSTSSTAKFINSSAGTDGTEWGAYISKLAVGSNVDVTGTQNYSMVLTYASSSSFGGLCIDDTATAATCPSAVGASLLADGTVISNAFDLAETYSVNGPVTPGDVVMMDPSTSTTVKLADGTPYNPKAIGVVSTDPGFVLGWNQGVHVALTGHVPTHVNMENGMIRVGDALTTSHVPGEAMKATKAGMIIGYALEDVNATGTAEVFVKVGYSAGLVLGNNGALTTINDNLLMGASGLASATNTAVDSWGLTFRGQAWDATSTSVVNRDYTLLTDVISATSSAFAIQNASGTDLFSIDENGNASVNGDLQVGGKLYLSSRGSKQGDYYVFLDQAGSSTYIGTNADGFQSLDTYDFAERFYSPDALEAGDLVVVKTDGEQHVQRSFNENDMLVGIVSTRPAFVAGRPATDTYPIALTGRVPTKVSNMSGSIKAGDALAPSNMPGVAVKATKTGPIVGLALEDFDATEIGKINVYVNPGWWTPSSTPEQIVNQTIINNTTATNTDSGLQRRGLAKIEAGSTHVHVSFDTINAYPFVQVTPRGLINGSWGTDGYTDSGFDILLSQAQSFDAYFSWQAEPLDTNDRLFQSDGTYLDLNQMTGQPIGGQVATTTATTTTGVTDTTTTTTSTIDSLVTTTSTLLDTSSTSDTTTNSGTSTTIIDTPIDTTSSASGTIDTIPINSSSSTM